MRCPAFDQLQERLLHAFARHVARDAGVAFADAAWLAGGVLATLAVLMGGTALRDCSRAAIAWVEAAQGLNESGARDGE